MSEPTICRSLVSVIRIANTYRCRMTIQICIQNWSRFGWREMKHLKTLRQFFLLNGLGRLAFEYRSKFKRLRRAADILLGKPDISPKPLCVRITAKESDGTFDSVKIKRKTIS